MADQLEGARTSPVKFADQGDGSVAEKIAIAGVVLVDTGAAVRNALPGASGAITGAAGRLIGYSIRETAGATAVLRLRDGTDATGAILDTISLAANESLREWFGPGGKAVATGVYYQLVSGTVEGAVFTRGV